MADSVSILANALSWPLRRVRKFITQRVENELRHEIALMQIRIATLEKNSRAALAAAQLQFDAVLAQQRAAVDARQTELLDHFSRLSTQQNSDHASSMEKLSTLSNAMRTALDTEHERMQRADERAAALSTEHERFLTQFDALRTGLQTQIAASQEQWSKSLTEMRETLNKVVEQHVASLRIQAGGLSEQIEQTVARIDTQEQVAARTRDTIEAQHRQYETLEEELQTLQATFRSTGVAQADRVRALEIIAADSQVWNGPAVESKQSNTSYFSIVLPTRNRAASMVAAIESVLAQSFRDWELLIVDDGSDDDTAKRVKPFLKDSRIRFLKSDGIGASGARNVALAVARGEFVAYLDSDNAWFPNFLAGMKKTFEADSTIDSAYGVLLLDTEVHGAWRVLWARFDRATLERGNYIDINTFVHRRSLVEKLGGFDERLPRLGDWDLVLRYTADGNCKRAAVAGARYSTRARERISEMQTFGDNWFRIQRKLRARPAPEPAPKVLYVMWHYPQLSETYAETELRSMLRFGIDVEVWSADDVAVPYQPLVPVHRGNLADAIAAVNPDVVHVHWLSTAIDHIAVIAAAHKPVTVRCHGFEVDAASVAKILQHDALHRLVLFPHQMQLVAQPDPRVLALNAVFDTALFKPAEARMKDRRMVLRTATALASKDLRLFLEAAKRCPDHRFVLIVVTAYRCEGYVRELVRMKAEMDSPAELLFNMPRHRIVEYVRKAGIYLHTAIGPEHANFTPIGMPVSIAEAMATGAYILARALPELRDYVGPAGDTYGDIDEACALIRATEQWDETRWHAAERRSIDHAWVHHGDDIVLQPLREEWIGIAHRSNAAV